jgi:hypothetical protein
MGYTPRKTVYLLEFEGTEHAGLQVKMRAGKMEMLFSGGALLRIDQHNPTAQDVEAVTDEVRSFVDHLISWNIEDEQGRPVPATLEGVRAQEIPLIALIMKQWQAAMGDVTGPLSPSSPPGLPDLAGIPTGTIPASLLS